MTQRGFWITAALVVGCQAAARPSALVDARVDPVAPSVPLIEDPDAAIAAVGFADDALLPCTEKADTDAARNALSTLGQRMDALEDGPKAPVKTALDALQALLRTPCFELAAADLPDELVFDSGIALRTWWNDGGVDALSSYLAGKRQLDVVIQPASRRTSLFLDGNESHPLAPLLCPSTDKTCGRGEAAGWYQRTVRHFEQRTPNADQEVEKCETEAKGEDLTNRWAVYRSCRLSNTATRATLPLGRFRAPTDGLLAIASFGHGSCGALRTYDLGSGTVIAAPCRGGKVEIGRVSVSALREAVWMLAFAGVATDGFRPQASVPVPADIEPGRPRNALTGSSIGLGGIYGSSWRREWTWLRAGKGILTGQMSGEVMRSGASHVANEHASALLEIVEASFVPGCAPGLAATSRGTIDWSRPGRRVYRPDQNPPFNFDQPDTAVARQALANARMPQICAAIP